MSSIFNVPPGHLKSLYSLYSLIPNAKSKEKSNMILEPLQAMTQVALLGLCPIGSKLAIHDNLLTIQLPTITQPINRWYNSDKKDDVYYLFQIIKRFIKWYGLSDKSPIKNTPLYSLIIDMAKKGLSNLIKTYETCESTALLQILQMYRDLLNDAHSISPDDTKLKMEKAGIDDVFINIMNIYDVNTINLITSLLKLVENEDDQIIIENYINGLNLILNKSNIKIKNWIKENLIF